MSDVLAASVSFRDPDGKLVKCDGRLFRVVAGSSTAARRDLVANSALRAAMESGALAQTWKVAPTDVPEAVLRAADMRDALVLEHEVQPFISYPCEWSALMLCDAGVHTLDMQLLALSQGLILKDAAPTNVLFRGSRPVFVDYLSFVERSEGEFLWRARHQFDACFLLPLLLNVNRGIPIAWSLRDFLYGVSHEQARRILGIRSWLKPSLLSAVAIPAALSSNVSAIGATHATQRKLANDNQARFVLERQATSLRAKLLALRGRLSTGASRWAAYTSSRAHYTADQLVAKREFVRDALKRTQPGTVLDLGANTGEFSELAAAHGRVVAIDIDEQSVSGIADRARSKNLDICPLVGNIAQPTPAEGWKNSETRGLIARLTQSADLVLMLALMHHLRITSGVPLSEIIDMLWTLTRRYAVLELVPPTDAMFAAMARGREPLYADCLPASAEALVLARFHSLNRLEIGNGRVLHLLERR